MQKNAKQHLQDACGQLKNVSDCLNQAMGTVEKPENRQEVEKALNAVKSACTVGDNALNNFRD
ncbi:hypothetical protein [Metaclostridioides mangenotii]|uniref:hypothetical protein n=1 Tax=Metaclostridioides mangenotii TaxID=1540 RepID=UPI0026EAB2D4|nr:hypothetical protein [Clostridioides mangenotii]